MALLIRPAKLSDLEKVLELHARSNSDKALPMAEATKLFENMPLYPHYQLFVIHDTNQIYGAFSLLIMNNLAHLGASSGLIQDLVFDSKVKDSGIEHLVLSFARARCQELKCYKLVLSGHDKIIETLRAVESCDLAQHGKCFVMNFKDKAAAAEKVGEKGLFFLPQHYSGLRIEEATLPSLPFILELYSQPGMDDGAILSSDLATDLYKKMCSYPNYKIYIALDGKMVVGTFALLIIESLTHQGKPLAIVEDVMVGPKSQGKGVGKYMMNFAMQACQKLGCYQLSLSSNLKRNSAHQFYLSLGFESCGASFLVDSVKAPAKTVYQSALSL